MPSAVTLRTDFSASELRRLAKGSKDANQTRRLLSLAAIGEGMNRADAARIGGMDRARRCATGFIGSTRLALTTSWTPGQAARRPVCRRARKLNWRPSWRRALT